MRKYILMYDPEEDAYCIARPLFEMNAWIAIDDVVYDDVVEGAQECQQLCNLMGEKREDAG